MKFTIDFKVIKKEQWIIESAILEEKDEHVHKYFLTLSQCNLAVLNSSLEMLLFSKPVETTRK